VRNSSARAFERVASSSATAVGRVTSSTSRAPGQVTVSRAFQRVASSPAVERIAGTHSYQAAHRMAHGRSRVSVLAASAAAAAVLGTAGFAIGAAPWAQAAGNVANVAQSGPQSAPGHPGSFLFSSISGTKTADGKTAGGINLDVLSAAAKAAGSPPAATPLTAPGGHAAATPGATRQPVKLPANAPGARKPAAKPAVKPAVKPKPPAGPTAPYLFYDSVKPGSLPAGSRVAVYSTGHYATSAASVAGHRNVLWIDTQGYNPAANVLDVEPGDATPARSATWAYQRLSADRHRLAIIYTMRAEWPAVMAAMATLPGWMHTKVRYWIADPTGQPHVVPGASATQWYWGNEYDISTANPDFER